MCLVTVPADRCHCVLSEIKSCYTCSDGISNMPKSWEQTVELCSSCHYGGMREGLLIYVTLGYKRLDFTVFLFVVIPIMVLEVIKGKN